MKLIYFLFILFFISLNCFADVYTEVDANGNTIFSDKPLSDNARRMKNSEINQSSSVEVINTTNTTTETTTSTQENVTQENSSTVVIKKPYTVFLISAPVDQESIQNQSIITVNIKIDPALQKGDKIQIYLDGRPWGAPLASTQFEFPQPDRGTHTISAKLIDSNQIVLNTTGTITVFIHRASIENPPPFNSAT